MAERPARGRFVEVAAQAARAGRAATDVTTAPTGELAAATETSTGLIRPPPPLLEAPGRPSLSPFSREFSSRDLSMFYSQLATMVEAGVSIQQALKTMGKTGPDRMRPAVRRLTEAVERGETLHETLGMMSDLFPSMDCHTLAISGQSGGLDKGLFALADYYEKRAIARSRIISASILPTIVLIVALLVVAGLKMLLFVLASQGEYSLLAFLRDTVGVFFALVLLLVSFVWFVRILLNNPSTGLATDRVLNQVPLLGGFRFNLALSQWVQAIRLMLNAGYGVLEAMDFASTRSSSPMIADAHARAKPMMNSQLNVAQALEKTRVFPAMLIQFWSTGEQSGKMDEMMERLAKYYDEVWQRRLAQISDWMPRIAYAFVALFIIYHVVQIFMGHLKAVNEALSGIP